MSTNDPTRLNSLHLRALKWLKESNGEGSLTISASYVDDTPQLEGWAWINHTTGRALERRGLAICTAMSHLDGPDAIELTTAGWEAASAL